MHNKTLIQINFGVKLQRWVLDVRRPRNVFQAALRLMWWTRQPRITFMQ